MDGEGLAYLVDFIGAMRTAKTEDPVRATVIEKSAKTRKPIKYSVEARTPEHSFSFTSPGFGMTYFPNDQKLIVQEGKGQPNSVDMPCFPWTPPVLAMFSPLDLPIWGGLRDSNKVISIGLETNGCVRLVFGNKEDPYSPISAGYAIVNLEMGIVTEMDYHDSVFTTSDVSATPLVFLP